MAGSGETGGDGVAVRHRRRTRPVAGEQAGLDPRGIDLHAVRPAPPGPTMRHTGWVPPPAATSPADAVRDPICGAKLLATLRDRRRALAGGRDGGLRQVADDLAKTGQRRRRPRPRQFHQCYRDPSSGPAVAPGSASTLVPRLAHCITLQQPRQPGRHTGEPALHRGRLQQRDAGERGACSTLGPPLRHPSPGWRSWGVSNGHHLRGDVAARETGSSPCRRKAAAHPPRSGQGPAAPASLRCGSAAPAYPHPPPDEDTAAPASRRYLARR